MTISIIIPLYNEENHIVKVLEKLIAINMPSFINHKEIIIVDDCSNDASYLAAKNFSERHSFIQIYKHQKNKGKGAAVRTGIEKSKYDIIIIQDADLELSPVDIPPMLEAMQALKVEFINGSRYMAGVIRPLFSYKRYLGNKFFTFLTALIINVKLTDMACGYKIIHKNLLNKLQLNENRFGFEAELIIKALRIKKNNIAEVPVHYVPRNKGDGKKLRNSDALKVLWTIIKYGLFRFK